ncbi:GAF domain-containing protein [Sinomicrobium weinanense]|uniref:GAF domain-containing protein n=1 Tax=Sinomicrobium weinanense TaxID=2842200 RepID=A0A926Q0R6_9FLAO|nr:GAF domain-containing protein [Sinomicrobium weinanense]MBC9795172.1 GAF domain-containing protein [Sinomicrobium weinanense]MBU3121949.1 GAF domain-containing protein [Sinomicrobium weinanense]
MKNFVKDSPFFIEISFHKLLDFYEEQARSDDEFIAMKAKKVLEVQKPYPELREGFSDQSLLQKYEEVIGILLQDTFTPALTNNEIKIAAIPFENIIFNSTARFRKIVREAGEGFDLKLRNMSEEHKYIMACTVILKFYYKVNINFQRPVFYDIPDANNILRHYRVLYNGDYLDVLPTEKAKEITEKDVEELLNSFDNLALWKEKFPPQSWILRGFGICNMYDATMDNVISELKTTLLDINAENEANFVQDFRKIFSTLYSIPDLSVGFCAYNADEEKFEHRPDKQLNSFIMGNETELSSDIALCKYSCKTLLQEKKYFAIANVDKYFEEHGEDISYKNLKEKGIMSAIFAPIVVDDGSIYGIMELGSPRPLELNSVNAQKLDDIMPYLITAINRARTEEVHQVEAIIQQEYTSIHSSVKWKFEKEIHRYLKRQANGYAATLREIGFNNVYPLYGQIDIKDSSRARNEAIQKDLLIQLSHVKSILEEAIKAESLPIYEEVSFRLNEHINEVVGVLNAGSEQNVLDFIKEEIHPFFDHLRMLNTDIAEAIEEYLNSLDPIHEAIYDHRKNYDESVTLINKKLAFLLDKKQEEAQQMFPHYFERYKTDGVEHNMYIGASIAYKRVYNDIYLYNLRLWQLQVMWEMENEYYTMQKELPVKLDVASLLLVHNAPLSIRFRMDEKQFDVDGTYNARYEIIKKRLDKALLRDSEERLTQKGKIAIVYSNNKDEEEYLRYIRFLQSKNYFSNNVEVLELEELQGVNGLRALRVEVLYKKGKDTKLYTYEDLMKELAS